MQHPWRFSGGEILAHLLGNSVMLVVFTLVTAFDSVIMGIASRLIVSKFVFQVLATVEYALVVSDAIMIVMFLILSVWEKLKRI